MWVFSLIGGLLFFTYILLMFAVILTSPLLIGVALGRRWLGPFVPRILIGCGFAFAALYMMYRMERFDVWRHGTPPLRTFVIYAAYGAVLGVIGWYAGSVIAIDKRKAGRPEAARLGRMNN